MNVGVSVINFVAVALTEREIVTAADEVAVPVDVRFDLVGVWSVLDLVRLLVSSPVNVGDGVCEYVVVTVVVREINSTESVDVWVLDAETVTLSVLVDVCASLKDTVSVDDFSRDSVIAVWDPVRSVDDENDKDSLFVIDRCRGWVSVSDAVLFDTDVELVMDRVSLGVLDFSRETLFVLDEVALRVGEGVSRVRLSDSCGDIDGVEVLLSERDTDSL
jgi:hypothetical protein